MCVCSASDYRRIFSVSATEDLSDSLRRFTEFNFVWSSQQLPPPVSCDNAPRVASRHRFTVEQFKRLLHFAGCRQHVRHDSSGVQSAGLSSGTCRSLDCCNGIFVVHCCRGSYWTALRTVWLIRILLATGWCLHSLLKKIYSNEHLNQVKSDQYSEIIIQKPNGKQ